MANSLLRGRGIRQITVGLGNLDREVFEAVAESPSPLLDATMPALTRAADHSKLWLAMAERAESFDRASDGEAKEQIYAMIDAVEHLRQKVA